MKERLIVVYIDKEVWIEEAIKLSINILKGNYYPSEAALEMFD